MSMSQQKINLIISFHIIIVFLTSIISRIIQIVSIKINLVKDSNNYKIFNKQTMVNYILFFSLGYSELIERLAIFSLIYENHFGPQSSSVTTYLNPLRSSDSTYSSTLTSQQSYGIFVSNQICSLCSD